ncbi:PAS domain S-box protein [Niastella caeni]|uniref:histidine kinase n=1 Tax=Niastella caeni TaxID=2569763 RepID=A0A4S8HUW8_9BACT|nr:PAS domain-containing sensor histidine kinase [Niastella caeni]THU39393.1 PAS domain S-box protein [Niastella caeni]
MKQVAEFFRKLLDTSDWPPRWHCGKWTEFHGWLYIISDMLVWSAYFAIPLIIIRYISKKHDARFIRIYFLFAGFILACGATHFFDAVTFWFPLYRVNALVRAFTGILSWTTVFYLIKVLPVAFTLRSSAELEAEVEQRKKAEEKFRNLLESAPDSMVIVNEDGIIQLVNAQTVKMFGYTREEMIGEKVNRLMPLQYDDFKQIQNTGLKPITEREELVGIRKEGEQFPIEITLSPLVTEEGLLISAAIRDISEKKLMEKTIREANINLERKVQQRTAELERKNKELEQFAYVASHDLQEPLQTTSGFVQLLRKQYQGRLDPSADQYIDYVVQASGRMKTLIKDLLDYSRIGREKECRQVDCNVIVKEVLADLHTMIEENEAIIKTGALPVLCNAYPTELKSLFQNLVSNSIKFRKPDLKPVLYIDALQTNGGWQFSVRDNGIGIEDQYLERIFVIFQRLHNRAMYDGSGIGLAHCKKIAELHGGKIWVQSEPGVGSTFYFTIADSAL